MKRNQVGKVLLVWLCIITLIMPFGSEVLAAALTSNSETARLETLPMRQGGPESSGTIKSDKYDETPYSYEIAGTNVLKILQEGDANYSDTFYCINASASFPTATLSATSFLYTNRGNFADKSNSAVQSWINKVGISEENYNALMYLLNEIYLMKIDTSYKSKFIETAFARKLAEESAEAGYDPALTVEDIMTNLTDDDIDVIQQWAIWYFTNGTNESNKYYKRKYSQMGSVKVSHFDTNTNEMVEEDLSTLNSARYRFAGLLYNYLVESARTAVNNGYVAGSSDLGVTYPTIDKTVMPTSTVDGTYYKVGPFKVNSGNYTPSDFKLDLQFEGTEGEEVNYDIYVNGEKSSLKYNEIFDQEYYIYLPIENNKVTKVTLTTNYTTKNSRDITIWTGEDVEGSLEDLQDLVLLTEEPGVKENESLGVKITTVSYDLVLRKFIVSVNGEATTGREPVITEKGLDNLVSGAQTTAEYVHAKNPVEVEKGDKIIYEFRIYNEGEVDARVEKFVDYLPKGLTVVDKSQSTINSKYNWEIESEVNGYTVVTTDFGKGTTIPAFDKETKNMHLVIRQIECELTGDLESGTVLTNVAEILNDNGDDRDSNPNSIDPNTLTDAFRGNTSNPSDLSDKNTYYKGLEDDDDFEKIVIKGDVFDLSLKKFISGLNDEKVTNREPSVNVDPLNNGAIDANYTTRKAPLTVNTGDIVTFTLRVYNEGDIAGYANEITDYIPEGLGFLVNYNTNYENYWSIDDDATSVKLSEIPQGTKNVTLKDFTDIDSLDDVEVVLGKTKVKSNALAYSETSDTNLIKAFDGTKLDYKDIEIACIVVTEDEITLKNIAAITAEKDEEGKDVETDRGNEDTDSTPKDDIDPDKYGTGNEDDDDYDVIKTSQKDFDLALQKFITGLNEEEVKDRNPVITLDNKGELVYSHTQDALEVGNGDKVTYTIRVYNEGDIDGYAAEISDDIPKGLVFLEENETNKKYGWAMYDASGKVTTDINQAVELRTSYWSKENSEEREENGLIKAFDKFGDVSSTNPDYRDVELVFKVDEKLIDKTIDTEKRTLINTAEITKATDRNGDEIEDKDSTPDNGDPDEDDIDTEKVYVKYFDLALKKDLVAAIVNVDGKTTRVNKPEDKESIKIEVHRKSASRTQIQFIYYVTVKNEGEIAGYATEIKDYIPNGLYFAQEDNSEWTQISDKVISTDALAKTLLQPGESASVQVVLRWEASENNIGKFVNIAEISEDWNEKDSDDVDSTPDNQNPPEDDYDTAPVYVSVITGIADEPYIVLGATVLAILGTGLILIKKYVL